MGDYWRFCARVMGSELKRCVNDNCPPFPPATWKQISKPYHNFHAFYEKLWMAAGGKSNSAKPTAYNSWRANSNILKLIIQSSRAVSELFSRSFFLLFFWEGSKESCDDNVGMIFELNKMTSKARKFRSFRDFVVIYAAVKSFSGIRRCFHKLANLKAFRRPFGKQKKGNFPGGLRSGLVQEEVGGEDSVMERVDFDERVIWFGILNVFNENA